MQSSSYLLLCASLISLFAFPAAAPAGPAQAAHRSWAADNGHEAVVKLPQSTAGDEVICDLRRSQIVR